MTFDEPTRYGVIHSELARKQQPTESTIRHHPRCAAEGATDGRSNQYSAGRWRSPSAGPRAPNATCLHARASAEPRRTSSAGRLDLQAHHDRLLRSACLLCGNETDAQDLVQETFLQAIKSAPRFRGDSTVHTWLHGILLNLSHRRLREQKHQRLVYVEEPVLSGTVQSSATITVDQGYYADQVADALQRLSPEHRAAIVMRYYESLKIHEIAERTGVSD